MYIIRDRAARARTCGAYPRTTVAACIPTRLERARGIYRYDKTLTELILETTIKRRRVIAARFPAVFAEIALPENSRVSVLRITRTDVTCRHRTYTVTRNSAFPGNTKIAGAWPCSADEEKCRIHDRKSQS